jgi:hypothetical protein
VITDILIEGVFDVSAVERYLATLPNTARDHVATSIYMVASSPSALRDAVKQRHADLSGSATSPRSVIPS